MLRHPGLSLWLAIAIALASTAGTARANGRPPATNGVFFNASDANAIYIRATFGLLISRDNGCSFRWVCEQNIGYGGTFDPKYAIGPNGEIYATTFDGLRVSRDGGCSFTTPTVDLPAGDPNKIAGKWVDALDVGPTGEVWVGTAASAQPNDLYRSTDGGQTFTPIGAFPPSIWWKGLAIAKSDPMRIYAAGYDVTDPPRAHLYSTTNGGVDWTPSPLTGVQFAGIPQILLGAVAPDDPDHVYFISVGANPPTGDLLYRSTDGGATFSKVLATGQSITDVVIQDETTVIAVSLGGAHTSSDGGATFGPLDPAPRLSCLGQHPDGSLIGCGTNWDPDFMAIGSSRDGGQWEKMFRFIELAGPVACPAGTQGHDVCDAELWPGLRQQFGATGPTCSSATDLSPLPDGGPGNPGDGGGGGGCCDAGAGSPLGFGLLTLLTAWAVGRRRRSRR